MSTMPSRSSADMLVRQSRIARMHDLSGLEDNPSSTVSVMEDVYAFRRVEREPAQMDLFVPCPVREKEDHQAVVFEVEQFHCKKSPQLTEGMYTFRWVEDLHLFLHPSEMFGLKDGQERAEHPIIRNAGWYNGDGNLLGRGDMDIDDFDRISEGLRSDEMFIVLSEADVFFHFTEEFKRAKGFTGLAKEYVAAYATYLVSKGELFSYDCEGDKKVSLNGFAHRFKTMDRSATHNPILFKG